MHPATIIEDQRLAGASQCSQDNLAPLHGSKQSWAFEALRFCSVAKKKVLPNQSHDKNNPFSVPGIIKQHTPNKIHLSAKMSFLLLKKFKIIPSASSVLQRYIHILLGTCWALWNSVNLLIGKILSPLFWSLFWCRLILILILIFFFPSPTEAGPLPCFLPSWCTK